MSGWGNVAGEKHSDEMDVIGLTHPIHGVIKGCARR